MALAAAGLGDAKLAAEALKRSREVVPLPGGDDEFAKEIAKLLSKHSRATER
jgi:hypothetical protein